MQRCIDACNVAIDSCKAIWCGVVVGVGGGGWVGGSNTDDFSNDVKEFLCLHAERCQTKSKPVSARRPPCNTSLSALSHPLIVLLGKLLLLVHVHKRVKWIVKLSMSSTLP